MKTHLMAITAAIAVLGAFSLAYSFDALPDISAQSVSNDIRSNALMTGHITLTGYDDEGNIIAYAQSDNKVVNNGDDCIAELIFTQATGGTGCTTPASYDVIHIGTGAVSAAETTTSLTSYSKQTTADTWAITPATGAGGTATLITANFFNVGATITEASIQTTSATDSELLAVQSFSAIPLGASDDLTIQWTVTIDGN